MRGQKGITLVALIITIVVLLILAVVAIGAVTDSNIINHADNAATTYTEKKVEENTTLQETDNTINAVIFNITSIK